MPPNEELGLSENNNKPLQSRGHMIGVNDVLMELQSFRNLGNVLHTPYFLE